MTSRDVRRIFLEFFAERGHQRVASSPLILPADPTLLFANAGMNQFKEVFRGRESRPYRRAASSQKCLRVSGKHNDLEEVGRTPRHHTFFEMLGNFSFGDYFKEQAIAWGWELVTEVYRLPADRLWVTVFAGDDTMPADEEAARIWEREIGLPAGRVVALGRKDNFWQMGETGPAGPCSEIHVDLAPGAGDGADPGSSPDRFLEIWNLVFMQYDLQADGGVQPLPAPSVDTGAGLERLTAVLTGAPSNYDTDLFQPIIQPLAAEAGIRYGESSDRDVSLRVIADHLRAITMLVTEGVIPGPEKRGAVLRRILRRALRHGRLVGLPVPFLHRHVAAVVDVLREPYPELREAQEVVARVTRREEERFDRTLSEGFELLEQRIGELLERGEESLPGEEAFLLESERGLPLDLVRDALEERRLRLDEPGYERARRQHVETSRVVRGGDEETFDADLLEEVRAEPTRFVGYESERVEGATVLAVFDAAGRKRLPALAAGEEGEVLLDVTPFYAESGGQIGDRGTIRSPEGGALVLDARAPLPGRVLHRVRVESGSLAEGAVVEAVVDDERRAATRRHHTATHLLHAGLRRILGPHVKQSGSLVTPERLRFDFSHFEPIPPEALAEIEDFVNELVLQDLPVETLQMEREEAIGSGAIAFFGDRYGEQVRVICIGGTSRELCGGTHVSRLGQIGPVLVTQERGVAAGVRRIEATAGLETLRRAREDREALQRVAERLAAGTGGEVLASLDRRLEQLRTLQKENERLRMELARGGPARQDAVETVDGVGVIARRAEGLAKNQRRDLADQLRQQHPDAVVVLGAAEGGKVALLVATGSQVGDRVDARALVRELAPLVGGGGGGRPDLAEAGGRKPEGLDAALAEAPAAVRRLLGGS
jgi:alanyl-tRNA synthetase